MKKKAIEKIPYFGLKKTSRKKDVKYIGVTAVKIVGHERHLFLEVYRNQKESKKGVTRKEYFDTLTSHGMAQEVVRMIRSMDDITELTDEHFWEHWLERTVDYLGRDLEEEE